MTKYYVVGGVYTDTHFDKPAPGTQEQRLGPFGDYASAKKEWATRTWSSVDDATSRWRIEQSHDDEDEVTYYVVGGVYTDTTFTKIAGGAQEGRFGPFTSLADAKKEWQARAFSTVDDALARFRIEKHRGKAHPHD